mgnify:FL=1
MIKVDVLVPNKNWKKYIRAPDLYINKKLKKIDQKINLFKKNNYSFTLLLSGGVQVKKLNIKFRKKNETTDILSFPFYSKKFLNQVQKNKNKNIYLGDIIINLKKIKKNIKDESFSISFDKIWIHGLAHLLGYRHKSDFDFSIMKKFETKLLHSIK